MKSIEQLIQEKFEEKLENGDFEKIISDSLDKMISNTLSSLAGYKSALSLELENKLAPILSSAIANSKLKNLTNKVTLLLNQIMSNSELSGLSKIEEKLKVYLGYPLKDVKTIKLSDIFNEYVKFAKNECLHLHIDDEDIEYECGRGTLYFTVNLEKIEENKSYFGNKKYKLFVTPNNDLSEYSDYPELDIEFEISDFKHIRFSAPIDLARLTYYPAFIWFLIQLSNNFVKVEVDNESISEEISIEYEEIKGGI